MRRFGEPWRIGAAGAVLALLLTGLVVREGRARAEGREVVLVLGAIDPRELLTGHSVILEFTEPLPPGAACPPGSQREAEFDPNRWVALRRDGGRHRAVGAARSEADARRLGEVVVRGALECGLDSFNDAVTLHIGVRRFHADQAEAEAIEARLRRRGGAPALALISVGRDGRARLNGLLLDGRRVELDWF